MDRCPQARKRWFTVLVLSAVGIVGAVGLAVATYLALVAQVRSTGSRGAPVSTSASPSGPACRTARIGGTAPLGQVVWIDAGSLRLMDLDTCRREVLLGTGAEPPVRFSADGRWVAFGDGEVVPSEGGPAQRPFGSPVRAWEWSPSAEALAGVTEEGGILVTHPGGQPETLLRAGSGVGHLSFSPDGQRLAFDRAGFGIQILDLAGGRARTILPAPDPAAVPEVAGWSPGGRWVLYWRGPVNEEGGPLDAVPVAGGPWVNVFDPVLPYRDLLSACGDRVAATVGSGQPLSVGKQIVLTGPPRWEYRNLTDDFSRSWFWPACSPDGRWLAATDTFSQEESPNGTVPRGLWLLAADGSSRRLLVPGTEGAPELPRWSSDGAVILVVLRSGDRWSSPGGLLLVEIDRRTGRIEKRVGPVVDVGKAPGPGGHQAWADVTDWYRPPVGG